MPKQSFVNPRLDIIFVVNPISLWPGSWRENVHASLNCGISTFCCDVALGQVQHQECATGTMIYESVILQRACPKSGVVIDMHVQTGNGLKWKKIDSIGLHKPGDIMHNLCSKIFNSKIRIIILDQ